MTLTVLSAVGGALFAAGGVLQLVEARWQEQPRSAAWQGVALTAAGLALAYPSGWSLLAAAAAVTASIRSEPRAH